MLSEALVPSNRKSSILVLSDKLHCKASSEAPSRKFEQFNSLFQKDYSIFPGRNLRDVLCKVSYLLLKLFWELPDDVFAEHISHFKCLKMNFIIGSNGCLIVTIQIGNSFLES